MNILRENIRDNRFLRLIEGALKAGYCEEWKFHPSLSGSPQGGIVSPILSNIYMDRLDRYVQETVIPDYTRGKERKANPTYKNLRGQAAYYRKKGNLERAKTIRREFQKLPSGQPDDPEYRRLRYSRYADDFLLGLAGPRREAEEIRERIATFLGTELQLTLSAEKTLITHACTGRARFLGYEIGIMDSQIKFDHRKTRNVKGKIGMYIPEDVLQAKRKRYTRDGKPVHRTEVIDDSDYDIITRYQWEYRGLVNYYGLAQNLERLSYIRWMMETSLLKTLADKHQSSVVKQAKRLKSTEKTLEGPRKCLRLVVQREDKKPLVAIFGGLSLKRRKKPVIKDQFLTAYIRRTSEIVERLVNDTCEICGAKEYVQMHHIRKLRDLNKQGKREMPLWMKLMISRKRKSIPLCKKHHDETHHPGPKSKRQGNRRAG